MFYHLEGLIAEVNPDSAAIDCGGIGFNVLITPNTAASLKKGEKSKLFISESVGEDHFDLYGFLTSKEKKYFELLTTVSGIGPKAALSVLSYNSPDNITSAIINENEKAFTACPGIGKKTAQRLILELKDKVAKGLDTSMESIQIPVGTEKSQSGYDNALAALSALGYNNSDIIPILRQIKTDGMTTEEIIKSVLKFMV